MKILIELESALLEGVIIKKFYADQKVTFDAAFQIP